METTPYWSEIFGPLDLESLLEEAFRDLKVRPRDQTDLRAFLEPLRIKNKDHYDHSVRVALLARNIGRAMGLDERAMLFSGLMHDAGKALVRAGVLGKIDGWTPADSEEIKTHVNDGFRLLRDRFDFTAEIMVWHHRFQKNCYPLERPAPLHPHTEGTAVTIMFYGRLLALADVFDALHRVNPKRLTGSEIRAAVEAAAPDLRWLVDRLYSEKVFVEHGC